MKSLAGWPRRRGETNNNNTNTPRLRCAAPKSQIKTPHPEEDGGGGARGVLVAKLCAFKLLLATEFIFSLVQIAKLCMIPASCLLEVVFDHVHYSRDTKLSIMVVLIGVAVCTVTNVSVNARGLIAAVIAVWSTAFQQYLSLITFICCVLYVSSPVRLLAITDCLLLFAMNFMSHTFAKDSIEIWHYSDSDAC
jgi:hypothetical protein